MRFMDTNDMPRVRPRIDKGEGITGDLPDAASFATDTQEFRRRSKVMIFNNAPGLQAHLAY
jgi:hypothetical protein